MKSWILSNYFLLGLVIVIGLAFVIPDIGGSGGVLHTEITVKLAIFVIFLLQGLMLPLGELRRGFFHWRIHLFVQSWIFIAMPLITGGIIYVIGSYFPKDLVTGFIFLAILPCTISTAVVFSTNAGGDASLALFNVTMANVLGVFIVPIFFSFWFALQHIDLPILPLFLKICTLLLLPFVIGQVLRLLHGSIRSAVVYCKKGVGVLNSLLILFIVFAAFCGSVKRGLWENQSLSSLLTAGLLTLFILCLSMVLVFMLIRKSHIDRAKKISVFFCACEKTLATGVPLAQSIFGGGHFNLGLILLPVLLNQAFQLFIGGLIVQRLARKEAVN